MVSERSGFYPRPKVDTAGVGVLSQAGGLLLTETIRVSGLGTGAADALAPWMTGPGGPSPGQDRAGFGGHAGARRRLPG